MKANQNKMADREKMEAFVRIFETMAENLRNFKDQLRKTSLLVFIFQQIMIKSLFEEACLIC